MNIAQMISERSADVFHVTHQRNVASIYRYGLECVRAGGARRVWFCTDASLKWALAHVCATHWWSEGDVAVLKVTVPVSWLKKHRDEVLYTTRDVPTWMI